MAKYLKEAEIEAELFEVEPESSVETVVKRAKLAGIRGQGRRKSFSIHTYA